MYQLVIVRHGESEWNRSNRFTGWTDIDLSPNGLAEAHRADALLKQHGYWCHSVIGAIQLLLVLP